MSRRNISKKRFPQADPTYNSYLVSLLTNRILKSGKKNFMLNFQLWNLPFRQNREFCTFILVRNYNFYNFNSKFHYNWIFEPQNWTKLTRSPVGFMFGLSLQSLFPLLSCFGLMIGNLMSFEILRGMDFLDLQDVNFFAQRIIMQKRFTYFLFAGSFCFV